MTDLYYLIHWACIFHVVFLCVFYVMQMNVERKVSLMWRVLNSVSNVCQLSSLACESFSQSGGWIKKKKELALGIHSANQVRRVPDFTSRWSVSHLPLQRVLLVG